MNIEKQLQWIKFAKHGNLSILGKNDKISIQVVYSNDACRKLQVIFPIYFQEAQSKFRMWYGIAYKSKECLREVFSLEWGCVVVGWTKAVLQGRPGNKQTVGYSIWVVIKHRIFCQEKESNGDRENIHHVYYYVLHQLGSVEIFEW